MADTTTRRAPIDFRAIAEQTGLRRGNLCCSPVWGWGVQNTYGEEGPSFACVEPPELQDGETRVWIEGNHWCCK